MRIIIKSIFIILIICLLNLKCDKKHESKCQFLDNDAYKKHELKYFNDFDLDSTWKYNALIVNKIKECDSITPFYFRVYDRFISLCINRRKINLGISYANKLCDFENYTFEPDNEYKSRAHRNLGFMLFRVYENEKSEIQNDLAFQYAIQANNRKLSQEAYLSQYFNYIMWKDLRDEVRKIKIDSLDNLYRLSIDQFGDLANYNRAKGFYHYQRGDYNKCISIYEKAIKNELNQEYPNEPILYSLYYQLSEAYENTGKFEKALEIYSKVEDDRFSFINNLRLGEINFSKYQQSGDKGDWLDSYNLLLRSDSLQYEQMKVILESDVLFFFNYRNQINELGMSLAYDWYLKDRSEEALEMFYTYSEKNKNALMQQERLLTRTSIIKDRKLRQETIDLNKQIKEANAKGYDFGDEYNARIQRLDEIYSTLEEDGGDFLKLDLPPLKEIQLWCFNNYTQVLSLSITVDKGYLLLISSDDVALTDFNISSELKETIDILMSYYSGSSEMAVADYQKYAYKIYEDIFKTQIESTEKIIFSPDGVFNFINIETLVTDTLINAQDFTDLKYLIYNHDIKVSSDIRGVIDSKKTKDMGKIAVFTFTSSSTLGSDLPLTELPATIGTAQSIKKLYPDSKIYSGKKATKANFLNVLKDTEISTIHLAIHGAASGVTREDVKLFFRTPRGGIDTLYGYELIGLETNVNRVVLASCESAKGVYEVGEGAYTLTRYFKAMGVDEVISQLWGAEDAASAYLFKSYYRINQLRYTKLNLSSSDSFSDPRRWGNVIW